MTTAIGFVMFFGFIYIVYKITGYMGEASNDYTFNDSIRLLLRG